MTALAPVAAAPVAASWPLPDLTVTDPTPAGTFTVTDAPDAPSVWLLEVVQPAGGVFAPAPFGLVAGLPVAAFGLPPDLADAAPPVGRFSDRGWVGEPDDADAPNVAFPPRLVEPPAIVRRAPIYPDEERRAVVSAGELVLANGDGALDALAGNARLGGRAVTLSRGPRRRPRHAPRAAFSRFGVMRITDVLAEDGGRLRVGLGGAELDLGGDACGTYGGTGGADGHAGLKGTAIPWLFGIRRNIEPVLEDRALEIHRVSARGVAEILGVRSKGVPLTPTGDVANRAALAALSLGTGTYATCAAEGIFRRSGPVDDVITCDARGDAPGGYVGSAGDIAARLLSLVGGVPAASLGAFAWPAGEVGICLREGTVAEAVSALAAGVGGYWGADAFGVFGGGTILPPETAPVAFVIEPWMLSGAPTEAGGSRPVRWRSRVNYRPNGRVMAAGDLAGAVSDADRAVWGRASEPGSPNGDVGRRGLYPLAEDPDPVESLFDALADADALGLRLDALLGVPRGAWSLPLGRWVPEALVPGAVGIVRWPGLAALAGGRRVVVREAAVDGDAAELEVWG